MGSCQLGSWTSVIEMSDSTKRAEQRNRKKKKEEEHSHPQEHQQAEGWCAAYSFAEHCRLLVWNHPLLLTAAVFIAITLAAAGLLAFILATAAFTTIAFILSLGVAASATTRATGTTG